MARWLVPARYIRQGLIPGQVAYFAAVWAMDHGALRMEFTYCIWSRDMPLPLVIATSVGPLLSCCVASTGIRIFDGVVGFEFETIGDANGVFAIDILPGK